MKWRWRLEDDQNRSGMVLATDEADDGNIRGQWKSFRGDVRR